MTATYNPTLASITDHIRLALGDTDTTAALLADETIQAKLNAFGYQEALAQLAEALVAQFGQKPSEYSEDGGLRLKWTERISAWQKIADDARAGKIAAPSTVKLARGATVAQTSLQAQTPSTPRTTTASPTLMEGFRAD
jgi:hypothetical protein